MNGERVAEVQLPFLLLLVELDHYRDFHCAGCVEKLVGLKFPFSFSVEGAERNAHIRVGLSDALLDGAFRGSELVGLGPRRRKKKRRGQSEYKAKFHLVLETTAGCEQALRSWSTESKRLWRPGCSRLDGEWAAAARDLPCRKWQSRSFARPEVTKNNYRPRRSAPDRRRLRLC